MFVNMENDQFYYYFYIFFFNYKVRHIAVRAFFGEGRQLRL